MTREEQLDWLCRLRSEIYVFMPKEWLIPMNNALDMSIKDLEQEPKTGHWIEVTNGRGGHECDLCHEYAPSYQSGNEYLTKYCPNCGCRMYEPKESEEV